jgi:signal transduction histidine kinase
MLKKYNTIGKRLFLVFSILVLNVIAIVILSYWFNYHNKQIFKSVHNLENQRVQIIQLLKLDSDFLRFETINQHFYATNRSLIIEKRDSLLKKITDDNRMIQKDFEEFNFTLSPKLDSIELALMAYNSVFHEIRNKIVIRGFKDFGLEGTMRQYAHELENHSHIIQMEEILMLRRHEKDFFLRKEKFYQDKFNQLADKLAQTAASENRDSFVHYLLGSYQDAFNKLASFDKEIGMTPTQGLLGLLNEQTSTISRQLETMVQLASIQANELIKKALWSAALISIITLSLSFLFTYITAIRIARPIKKLSNVMSKYVFNEGINENEIKDDTVTDEIRNLSGSFVVLTRKLKSQFDETKKKSTLVEHRNKELQKLNAELDRFIYSSAHDLKSPLASLDGLVNLARLEINSQDHDHYFEKMKKSIERMNGFIRDITDYAKNKRQRLHVERVELDKLIDDIFQSLDYLPEMKLIRHWVAIEPLDFFTDRTRLEIILKNLISNAIKYADLDKQQPIITVRIMKVADERIKIAIEDNGIGIDEQHLPRIFEMFYRAVENAKGSGIGLFLVRESVKMLRGQIMVKSELSRGTTFTLILPNLQQINVNYLPESEPINILEQQAHSTVAPIEH